MKKHPTLKKDEYYDIRTIGAGRKDKVCEYCGKAIPKGESHKVHTFLPDPNFVPDPNIPANPNPNQQIAYRSFPTHTTCSEHFYDFLID